MPNEVIIHLAAHQPGYPRGICGAYGQMLSTTWNPEEVTCPDCGEAAAVTLVVTKIGDAVS